MLNWFNELTQKLPDDFSKTLLLGATTALNADNPLRAHHFATSMRELVGHVLHKLAPDELVENAPWFKKEANKPTRRQRATFAVRGGLAEGVMESFGFDPSEMHGELLAAIDELNKYTHVREETLLQNQNDIEAFAENAIISVAGFLDTIDELRSALGKDAVHHIGTGVFEKFIGETIDELDILSTHTQPEGVQVEEVTVTSIGLHEIEYEVEGTVYVQLIWGSGSDFDRGDGATQSEAFPFKCSVKGDVEDPTRLLSVSPPEVDTSSWYE